MKEKVACSLVMQQQIFLYLFQLTYLQYNKQGTPDFKYLVWGSLACQQAAVFSENTLINSLHTTFTALNSRQTQLETVASLHMAFVFPEEKGSINVNILLIMLTAVTWEHWTSQKASIDYET